MSKFGVDSVLVAAVGALTMQELGGAAVKKRWLILHDTNAELGMCHFRLSPIAHLKTVSPVLLACLHGAAPNSSIRYPKLKKHA